MLEIERSNIGNQKNFSAENNLEDNAVKTKFTRKINYTSESIQL